jgi:uncharacterized protein DUF4402
MVVPRRSSLLVYGAAALSLAFAAPAAAAPSTASASAQAVIVNPIVIAKNTDLDFGKVAAGTGVGTVVMSNAGLRTPSGVLLPSTTGTVSVATFTVTGDAGASYSLTLPNSTTINSGGDSMLVNAFTSDSANTITGGSVVIHVGATLNVGASQPAGLYTGSFNVTVDYN